MKKYGVNELRRMYLDFFKSKDIDRIVEKLRQQKHAVLKKQQELKRIEQKIDHRLNWLMVAKNRRKNSEI